MGFLLSLITLFIVFSIQFAHGEEHDRNKVISDLQANIDSDSRQRQEIYESAGTSGFRRAVQHAKTLYYTSFAETVCTWDGESYVASEYSKKSCAKVVLTQDCVSQVEYLCKWNLKAPHRPFTQHQSEQVSQKFTNKFKTDKNSSYVEAAKTCAEKYYAIPTLSFLKENRELLKKEFGRNVCIWSSTKPPDYSLKSWHDRYALLITSLGEFKSIEVEVAQDYCKTLCLR